MRRDDGLVTQRNWVLYRIHDTCTYLEKAALLASDTGAQQKGEVLPVQRHLDVEVERSVDRGEAGLHSGLFVAESL